MMGESTPSAAGFPHHRHPGSRHKEERLTCTGKQQSQERSNVRPRFHPSDFLSQSARSCPPDAGQTLMSAAARHSGDDPRAVSPGSGAAKLPTRDPAVICRPARELAGAREPDKCQRDSLLSQHPSAFRRKAPAPPRRDGAGMAAYPAVGGSRCRFCPFSSNPDRALGLRHLAARPGIDRSTG
jgi:hypothetical protein